MFAGDESDETKDRIAAAVDYFSRYDDHKTHGRPLTFEKLSELGLKLKPANGDLKDLLREAHVLLTGMLAGTDFVKLFENSTGLSWGRRWRPVQSPMPFPEEETPEAATK